MNDPNWSTAAWFVALLALALAALWLVAAVITFVALWRGARVVDDEEMRAHRRLSSALDPEGER